MQKMLETLINIFKGKLVKITPLNPYCDVTIGTCETVLELPDFENSGVFNIVLVDEKAYKREFGFEVDYINARSVLRKDLIKIELLEEEYKEAFGTSCSYFLCFPKNVLSPTATNNILFRDLENAYEYFFELKKMGVIENYIFLIANDKDEDSKVVEYSFPDSDTKWEVVMYKIKPFNKFSN